MKSPRIVGGMVLAAWALGLFARPAGAYIEIPFSLGRIVSESTNIVLMRVESVDKEKNLVVFRKVADLKGTHKTEQIKHNIGRGGFHPREWQTIMAWAEVGRTALFFYSGTASETCIDNYWYQTYGGDWWNMSHAEPYLLRTFAGKPEKLAGLVTAMLGGQEVLTPCMIDGDKNALQLRTARLQRMKASLKIQDYNPTRDFAGWGVEEFRAIGDMPAFTHQAPLARVSPHAAGVAATDFDGDGRTDFCLFGPARVALVQNTGGSFNEIALGLDGAGAYSADWADFNGDGQADLLLATPFGARLFAFDGKAFRNVTAALPGRAYDSLTAAAWIDYDGDGRPDVLAADAFGGLRLYRNRSAELPPQPLVKAGDWHYAGPFDNPNNTGFDVAYPPEKELDKPPDLAKEYVGKNNQKVVWRKGEFPDGQINNLRLFADPCNDDATVYLYRELEAVAPLELPISLGSDDTLTVWLNGRRVHGENVYRPCAPDQAQLKVRLKPGKNRLVLKVCQGMGEWSFYYQAKEPADGPVPQLFEDVSEKVGLGPAGLGGKLRGDRLAVADVNGDGRVDFLFSAGTGLLAINTPAGFVASADSGLDYQAGQVSPVFGDFSGDGRPDLFVPQTGRSKLYLNDGKGRFTDVTGRSGALGGTIGQATCAAWVDLFGQGRRDLMVGCLRGPNRYFRNNGDGTFADLTEQLGLDRRIFNTRGLAVLDVNKDGVADVVFVNEGQESAVLLGNAAVLAPRPPAGGK